MGQRQSNPSSAEVPEDEDDRFAGAAGAANGHVSGMSNDPNPQSSSQAQLEYTCHDSSSSIPCHACSRRLISNSNSTGSGKPDETSSIESSIDEEHDINLVKSSARHHVLDLSNQSLSRLTHSVANLHNLTRINLANNQLETLPKELGHLDSLRTLDVSNNRLVALPGSMSMLTKLKALNISHNRLKTLPSSMGAMPRLMIIIAHSNQFTHLPVELGCTPNLVSLNISQNPSLRVLPVELVMNPSLRKLVAEDCGFADGQMDTIAHDPPSLLEICARQIVRTKTTVRDPPEKLRAYFDRVQWCSSCKGPFFDTCVKRTRYIERMPNQPLLIEYRLCSAHWVTDDERILNMFASQERCKPRQVTVIDNYSHYRESVLPETSSSHLASTSYTSDISFVPQSAPRSSYSLHAHSAMIQLH